jgi:HEAT repeat protein
VWRGLLAVARDSASRPHVTRNNAAFWLSRFAAAKLDGHGEDLAASEDEAGDSDGSDARSSAVFALSQLRDHEGIPPLMEVARTNKDAHLRRQALFWLGQSGDPRGLALFEEILAR